MREQLLDPTKRAGEPKIPSAPLEHRGQMTSEAIPCDRAKVAIHQPNYLPWLGYFYKIAVADVFVFLDDVQFSKGSYINRVRILASGAARWLTIPVSSHLGDPINRVAAAKASWAQSHLDTLRGFYSAAPEFKSVWPSLGAIVGDSPKDNIAMSNRHIVECIAAELGLRCTFVASSDFEIEDCVSDDRLVRLTKGISAGGTYLSGRGGAKYQDEEKFAAAGLGFRYVEFDHPTYSQNASSFVSGLSVIDAIFHLGWSATSDLLHNDSAA